MLSTIFLAISLSQPMASYLPWPPPAYTVKSFRGDVVPPTKPKGYPF